MNLLSKATNASEAQAAFTAPPSEKPQPKTFSHAIARAALAGSQAIRIAPTGPATFNSDGSVASTGTVEGVLIQVGTLRTEGTESNAIECAGAYNRIDVFWNAFTSQEVADIRIVYEFLASFPNGSLVDIEYHEDFPASKICEGMFRTSQFERLLLQYSRSVAA